MNDATTLAGRRLWIGIPGPDLDDDTRGHLEALRPGGVVLFARNIQSRDQTRHLVGELRELLGDELRVSVDQEGGLVVRFDRELTVFPGNMALGATAVREPSLGEHLAERQGELGARELRELGIDVNLAPVLDLMTAGGNPGIGTRSFGEHVRLAERLGSALIRGSRAGGVLTTLKHFPGKGAAEVDAHLDLPVIAADVDQAHHLIPFETLIREGAPLVMTSHVIYQALDADQPATFSGAIVTELLREQLGFKGVSVTDDLEMGAMVDYFGFDEMIRRAAAAGHDVFCIAHRADRQRRAFELLQDGLERRERWAGDPDAIAERLDALDPGPASDRPVSFDEGQEVARAIAGRAVTVVRDDAKLLPIRGKRCLLAVPTVRAETGVEDPLRGEDPRALAGRLDAEVEVRTLSPAPDAEEVRELLAAAAGFERLLLVTTLARFQPAQAALARAAVAAHAGTVLLPLRNPFDLEVLPSDARFTAVTPYGFRPVHLDALAPVLNGDTEAWGRLPVTLEMEA